MTDQTTKEKWSRAYRKTTSVKPFNQDFGLIILYRTNVRKAVKFEESAAGVVKLLTAFMRAFSFYL
jgi:hypothetical protein